MSAAPWCPAAAVRGSRAAPVPGAAGPGRCGQLPAGPPRGALSAVRARAAGGRCDEHACDVALIAGYLEAAEDTMAGLAELTQDMRKDGGCTS